VGVGAIVNVPVKVRNASPCIWPATGKCEVSLSYCWLDKGESALVSETERTHLPRDLRPGEETVLDVVIRAPTIAGDYFLEFDLVQEFVAWFKDKGSQTARVPMAVVNLPNIWPVSTVSTLDDFVGTIDHIGFTTEEESVLEVAGWVLSRTRGLAESAAISLDSTLLGNVKLGEIRHDVASLTNSDLLLTGWSGRFRILPLRPGYHLVELCASAGLERGIVPHATQIIVVTVEGSITTVGRDSPGPAPLPPPDLIELVAGTRDVDWFLRSGAMAAWTVEQTLSKVMKRVDDFCSILDFGCGCGRVIRHFERYSKPRFHGSDYNPILIDYCRKNLSFAIFENNSGYPPTPYKNQTFDFIYAFSVLTHMTLSQQRVWLKELTRILKKRGFLLMSTHGQYYRRALYGEDRRMFDAGHVVVHRPDVSGTNVCMAYHPPGSLLARLPENLVMINSTPEGAKGNPHQDLFLLMKV